MKFTSSSFNGEKLTGELTIRDVSKTIELDVDFNGVAVDPYGQTKAGFEISGEINRKDYLFLSDKKFSELIKKRKFLEYAEVFGFKYGTLIKTFQSFFEKKKDVLFDIDWQGFQQLKQSNMEVVGIFILPPSKKELIKRLQIRGRDTKNEMKKRMSMVQNEISHFPEYDYVVINKNLKSCVEQIKNIIQSERLRRSRLVNLTSFVNKFRN